MRIAAGLPRPPALRLERPQLKDMACEAPQYPWRTPHLCMFFFYKSSGKTSSSFRLRFASHSESTVTLSHKDP